MSLFLKNHNAISIFKGAAKDKITSPTGRRPSVTFSLKSEEKEHPSPSPETNLTEKPDVKKEFNLVQVGNRLLHQEKVLYTGAAFGEIALMDNVRRKATIIAKQDSHFAFLDKEHFDKILSNCLQILF